MSNDFFFCSSISIIIWLLYSIHLGSYTGFLNDETTLNFWGQPHLGTMYYPFMF